MKVAVIQLNATKFKERNLSKALSFVHRAIKSKADFILLPEVFVYRGALTSQKQVQSIAENVPGETIRPLMSLARKYKVCILAGSILEKSNRKDKVYNTSILINTQGEIAAKYRKIHLFDAVIGKKKIKESDYLLPGKTTAKTTAMTNIGRFHVGLTICYDLRFPDLYQNYTKRGAHILCVPSAFTKKTGQPHWEILLRARAVENMCYVLAPNQIGKDSRGIPSYGHSMIINPWGEILARASGDREEIIFADLSFDAMKEKRKILPAMNLY